MYFSRLNDTLMLKRRWFSVKPLPPKEKRLNHIPPDPKVTTGFRGNHNHGRRLYDQVYPTTKVPTVFLPRYPLDWRNAGRFILTSGMGRIEGRRLYRHPHSLNYQTSSHCGDRCASVCSKSQFKCLCSLRSNDLNEHIANVDSMLTSYKAPVDTNKQVFSVLNYVPKKSSFISNKLLKLDSSNRYKLLKKTYKFTVFNDRDQVSTSNYDNLLPQTPSYSIFDVKQ
ncbi:conserved hypothetical protein [Theileria orientalis strain Shintoku]|uniref:Uncharacterized protein n=1 Tax=Theileria orientalis strain Shintoku TaxID=869250 RepID=J4CDZ9_THEOR|nr:conserved hypothetical protein [Theileria orientalis strain Shintoku]PVC52603.1 hypothetical protein MACL_00000653 [Theileria orientalis]BAM42022.1 conserved hypothetical protein [Theileria orientalis strain Shintoku]|eukprot:XP_009692323.1 conserved hypothetical protein [Theileria orientalis strain Shintoku]